MKKTNGFFPGKRRLLRKIKMDLSNIRMDLSLTLLLSPATPHQLTAHVIN